VRPSCSVETLHHHRVRYCCSPFVLKEHRAMPPHQIDCPRCALPLQSSSAWAAGQRLRCPRCTATFLAQPLASAPEPGGMPWLSAADSFDLPLDLPSPDEPPASPGGSAGHALERPGPARGAGGCCRGVGRSCPRADFCTGPVGARAAPTAGLFAADTTSPARTSTGYRASAASEQAAAGSPEGSCSASSICSSCPRSAARPHGPRHGAAAGEGLGGQELAVAAGSEPRR
jgi:hypothetical protein